MPTLPKFDAAVSALNQQLNSLNPDQREEVIGPLTSLLDSVTSELAHVEDPRKIISIDERGWIIVNTSFNEVRPVNPFGELQKKDLGLGGPGGPGGPNGGTSQITTSSRSSIKCPHCGETLTIISTLTTLLITLFPSDEADE